MQSTLGRSTPEPPPLGLLSGFVCSMGGCPAGLHRSCLDTQNSAGLCRILGRGPLTFSACAFWHPALLTRCPFPLANGRCQTSKAPRPPITTPDLAPARSYLLAFVPNNSAVKAFLLWPVLVNEIYIKGVSPGESGHTFGVFALLFYVPPLKVRPTKWMSKIPNSHRILMEVDRSNQ